MARCTDRYTRYPRGYRVPCEARVVANRFCWRWFKGVTLINGWRGLQRNRSSNTSFWNVLATIATALATIAIAVATGIYTDTSKEQWKVMGRQLLIMEYQQRPWLGVSQTHFTQEPQPRIGEPDRKALALTVKYLTKNFGSSPAFAVNMQAIFQLPYGTVNNELVKEICQQAENSTQRGTGQVIFPGSDFTRVNTHLEQSIPFEAMQALPFVSISICIFYRDTARQMHHTKIWLMYKPSTGVETVDQEAT